MLASNLFQAALVGAIGSAAVAGGAPVVSAAVLEGDNVAGVGLVTNIDNLAINNFGQWFVEVDTDNADTNADGALLRGSTTGPLISLFLREGAALGMPAGATVDSFDAVTINNNGDGGFNFFLDGTTGTGDDSGVFYNTSLVIQESTVSTSAGFSAGTPYIGWFEVKLNDNNSLLMMSSVDDPNIPSTVDRALVRADLDGSGGLISEKVYVKEGDSIAGQLVAELGTGPHNFDFNNGGHAMFVADLDGATTGDGAVVISDGDTHNVIAQEGTASGIQGRNWGSLSTSTVVALNDNGDWAMRATLAGDTTSDTIIVRNGEVIAQEGSGNASIGSWTFTSFGTGPIGLANGGWVVYYGDWNDPNTDIDTGIFLNDILLVQEGVTMVDGVLIDTISSTQDGFSLSDNGEWLIFEATLIDGRVGAFTLRIPAPGAAAALALAGLVGLRRRR